MRIGTSLALVDLDRQLPNRNQRECLYWWDELFEWIAAAGFSYIELPYQPKWDFGGRSGIPLSMRSIAVKDGDVAGFLTRLRGHGLAGISAVHLDPSLFFSSQLDRYFGAFEHFAMEALELAALSGAGTLTLTATPCVGDLRAAWPDSFLERTAALFSRMQAAAAPRNVRICLRNECWGLLAGEAAIPFLEGLHPEIRLDLDTAHLQISGVESAGFLRSHASRIGIVHLTDTRHRMTPGEEPGWIPEHPRSAATSMFRDVGTGDVDLVDFVDAMKETGFDGDVILDSRHAADVCRALLRMRRFALRHFEPLLAKPQESAGTAIDGRHAADALVAPATPSRKEA